MLTPAGRSRALADRLATWTPLIGEQAATTATHSLWWGQAGFLIGSLWLAIFVPIDFLRGTDARIIQGVATAVLWPAFLFCGWRYIRLDSRAQREASAVAGTSAKARPPVRNLDAFYKWRERSHYAEQASETA